MGWLKSYEVRTDVVFVEAETDRISCRATPHRSSASCQGKVGESLRSAEKSGFEEQRLVIRFERCCCVSTANWQVR